MLSLFVTSKLLPPLFEAGVNNVNVNKMNRIDIKHCLIGLSPQKNNVAYQKHCCIVTVEKLITLLRSF